MSTTGTDGNAFEYRDRPPTGEAAAAPWTPSIFISRWKASRFASTALGRVYVGLEGLVGQAHLEPGTIKRR